MLDSQNLKIRSLILFPFVIFFCAISMFYLDQSVASEFDRPEWKTLSDFCRVATDAGLAAPYFVLVIVVYLFAWLKGPQFLKWKSYAAFCFRTLISVGILLHLIKFTVGRQRPYVSDHFSALDFLPFNFHADWQSFPSGHSQLIFTVMTLMSLLLPKHKWIFFTFAFFIATTRVITHQHFLSDVMMGGAIGYLGTLWMHHWFPPKS